MNDQIRHRSPKTQNNFFNNYYLKSPPKKDINIINFSNTNNYYEEITKAFNFITFILKQKDSQIKELKIKIKLLEKQLNDINETNIMTFNNKNISDIYNDQEKTKNKNGLKRITYNNYNIPNNFPNKISNENNNKLFNNNINIINRVKNSTNINKINNYRNNIDLNGYKLNYMNKTSNNYSNSEENINKNINEYSNEKKNINIIRKEPYHSNININNFKYRNSNGNINNNLNTNETDTSVANDKIKIFNLNMGVRTNSKNSKNNSITLSDEGIMQSKAEIKNYLKEIKNKIDKEKFKKFVELIKILIKNKNNNSTQKKTII